MAIVTINDMRSLVIILQFQNVSFTILKKKILNMLINIYAFFISQYLTAEGSGV